MEAPGVDRQVQEKIDTMVAALKKEQADEVKKKDLRSMAGGLAIFSKRQPLIAKQDGGNADNLFLC